LGSSEWRDANTDTAIDATTVNLVYPDGIVVLGVGDGGLVVTGNVKTGNSTQAVADSFNFLSSIYPAGSTLESLFGTAADSTLDKAAAPGNADQVWLPSEGAFTKYYVRSFLGSSEWRNVDTDATVDATTVLLDDASGYVLLNVGGSASLDTPPPSFYSSL